MSAKANEQKEPNAALKPSDGFGAVLKQKREESGISIGDMAAKTRLAVGQVRAIEEEDMNALPEPVYVRAFIRGIATVLGLDPRPLVADYARRYAGGSMNGILPDHNPDTETVVGKRRHSGLKTVIVLLIIALAAAGGWKIWSDQFGGSTAEEAVPAGVSTDPTVPETPAAEPAAEQKPEAAETAETATPAEGQQAAPAAATAQTAPGTERPAVQAVPSPAMSVPAPEIKPEKPVVAETDIKPRAGVYRARLTTTGAPCWVQISNKGKLLFSKEIAANSSASLDLPADSDFVLGNPGALRMTLDGKAYTLACKPGSTCRFKLK